LIRTYFNDRAGVWDETVSEKNGTKLELMAGRLNIAAGSTLLDVGTGTGVFIPFLQERLGAGGRIIGLDFAGEMLRVARRKGFEGDVDFLCADVACIPVEDGTFDSIVCYSSFPHFQDKLAAFIEMKRVLRDGGRLFICHTSSRHHINGIHQRIPVVCDDIIPEEDEMLRLLARAGFTDIEIEDNRESYFCSAVRPDSEQFEGLGFEFEADVKSLYRVSQGAH